MPDPQFDDATAAQWLGELYAHADPAWLSLFSLDRTSGQRRVDWGRTDAIADLADLVAARAATSCVWFGVATRHQRAEGGGRGSAADCHQITALWADIDWAGPNHAHNDRLPPDETAARDLLKSYPHKPSAVVWSGGGLQPWWLLDEPVDAADAADLLAAWGHTWDELARRKGYHVDNVFDLARIMRLPGTINRKNQPTLVEMRARWDRRYSPSGLWLLDPPAPTATPNARIPYIGPERPGDAFNAHHDGGQLLEAIGCRLAHTDRDNARHYVRPGKDAKDGTSATVYADGHTTIWSDTLAAAHPTLEVRRPYDPFGLYVATQHRGDWRAATEELASRGYGEPRVDPNDLTWISDPPTVGNTERVDGHGWETVDLSSVASGEWEPLRPAVGAVTGSWPLFYEGRINGLFGESGSGKSWVAIVCCAQELNAGRRVLYIDLEDHHANVVGRLRALGVDPDAIVARFSYISPQLAWNAAAADYVTDLAAGCSLVVIDSTGEALALDGLKQNDDDEVARWHRRVARRIAATGPAVLLVDHIPKATDSPTLFQIGSQRKKAAIDGAMFRVEQTKALGVGQEGSARLIVGKDRNGTHSTGSIAADLELSTSGDGTTTKADLNRHVGMSDPDFRPTYLMEQVSRLLEGSRALTGRQIRANVKGKDKAVRRAVECLVDEGFVGTHTQGQAVYHHSLSAFRDESSVDWVAESNTNEEGTGNESA